MQEDRLIHTALPAIDLERAKRFYAAKLGLTPETESPDMRDGLYYLCGGGTRFLVFPSPNAACGAHTHDLEKEGQRGHDGAEEGGVV